MHSDLDLAVAILNGYPKASRDRFDATDTGHPQDMYADFLKRYVPNVTIDVLFVADESSALPTGANLSAYDGYIWTGSDLTIYHEDDERVTRQVELSKAIYESGVPQYGSCWGVQMAVWAAGGEVKKNPKGREWGIARRIQRTAAGRQSLLLQGKPDVFDGFIMHLDEVTRMPSGGTVLATNDHTRIQAVEVTFSNGTFWATQYHPEYNLREMARLISARTGPLVKEGFFDAEARAAAYAQKMFSLAAAPDSRELQDELAVGLDILDPVIREVELRNWIDHLVLSMI